MSTFHKVQFTKRIISYTIVGVAAFVTEYVSFLVLLHLVTATPYALLFAQSISFILGLIVSFSGNRFFTFNSASGTYKHTVSRQVGSYVLLAVINLLLTNAIIYVIVHHFAIHPTIAKVIVMLTVVLWNFLIFNKFIFKSEEA